MQGCDLAVILFEKTEVCHLSHAEVLDMKVAACFGLTHGVIGCYSEDECCCTTENPLEFKLLIPKGIKWT